MSGSNDTDNQALALELMHAVLGGATFKDLKGVPDEHMHALYAFAHRFYEQGRLDEAARFFHFLCIYDFQNADYWCGHAAVRQLQGHYQKAIDLYAVAFALRTSDYRSLLYTGQCHLALGRPGKAKLCFEYAVESLTDAGLKAQAQAYLDGLVSIQADHSED